MEEKKQNKRLTSIIVIVLVVLILCAAGGYMFFNSGTGAVSEESQEVVVTIESGSGYYQIIDTLDEADLIKNKTMAKVYIKLFAPDNLQANTYVLNQNMDLEEMMQIISTGDFQYLLKTKFTIIEGSTILEAAAGVAEALGFESAEVLEKWADTSFLKELINEYWFLSDEILNPEILFPLEGYLYPETYFIVEQEPSIESVTRLCLDMMGEKLKNYQSRIEELEMTPHEFLSLASVVQAESLHEKDFATIAGVFFNRIKAGMPLQSDITVLYALQDKRVNVTYGDLEVDSKYNTYKYAGLPVGPVCTVQNAIMDACANYEQHDYYYFFATEDGTVLYSKTLDEHNQTVKDNLWY